MLVGYEGESFGMGMNSFYSFGVDDMMRLRYFYCRLMDNNVLNAVEVFKNRVKEKELELNRLKKAVNDMAQDAGLPLVYSSVATETVGSIASITSDQFYGQGLSTAIRMYLEMRKASGLSAANVNDIYEAVKTGGYKFETKDEENAKTGVRNTLRKNSAQFHRLPNGEYGLLSWYPNAKPAKDDEGGELDSKPSKEQKAKPALEINGNDDYFTNDQIRETIFAENGNFQASEIEKTLKTNFPSKKLRPNAVSKVIFVMKGAGLLKLAAERYGTRGASYCKA